MRLEITGVNLFAGNRDHRRMLAYLAAVDSDVIVVQELTSAWTVALETLAPRYPHRLLAGGDIGVLSKHPITRIHGRIDGVRGGHGRALEIDAAGVRLTVLALHPPAPMFAPLDARRRREIDAAAAFARSVDGPLVVSGDFNATPWAAPLRRFLAGAGLALPAGAWGGTWPWFLGPFAVSIDHILAGGGCAVVERRVGPPVGSDHRPVHATVRCRAVTSPAP
ncbi:MAG: endonuclease/exonuclease/phosphatase family protein [Rhodospirillales bacterium]|nr:MAG: endonuclease/exonuclease/phosphatase family protein [Rhodospirillales bacterium]